MKDFTILLRESLPEIIGGLVVAAILSVVGVIYVDFGILGVVIIVVTILLLSLALSWFIFKRRKAPLDQKEVILTSITYPKSELVSRFRLRRNQIVAKIYEDYSLDLDGQVRTALIELNALRRRQKLREYYSSTRFRLIRPPQPTKTGIELHLAPMNFAHVIMLKDPNVSVAIKEYVRNQIEQVANRIPKQLQSTHPILNGRNYHPLGVEIAIVTKDKKTLLRRRGESVLLSTVEWDVSYSGYCGEVDRLSAEELDIGLTVEHELQREIGILTADHREILFTGLHRNANTGAIDIIGTWETEAKTSELVDLLAEKYPGIKKAFDTTKRAEEPFVWDTTNLIVDFDGPAISQALKEISSKEGKYTVR